MMKLKVVLDGLTQWSSGGGEHAFSLLFHQQLLFQYKLEDIQILNTAKQLAANVPVFAKGVPLCWIDHLLAVLVAWRIGGKFPWTLEKAIHGITFTPQNTFSMDGHVWERLSSMDSFVDSALKFFDQLGAPGIFKCLGFNSTVGSIYNYMPGIDYTISETTKRNIGAPSQASIKVLERSIRELRSCRLVKTCSPTERMDTG